MLTMLLKCHTKGTLQEVIKCCKHVGDAEFNTAVEFAMVHACSTMEPKQ